MDEKDAPRILAFAGSTRQGSWNKKVVRVAAAGAEKAGGKVTYIDLRDYPLPLFDEDLEEKDGVPEPAIRLKELFCAHQGLLIASPEYNSSISGVLKNAIDWLSRPMEGGLDALGCFKGKVLCLMSASPGRLGGLRGLVHVRAILGNLGVIVLPDQIAVPNAQEAFSPDGTFKNAEQQASVEQLGGEVVSIVSRLYGRSAVALNA